MPKFKIPKEEEVKLPELRVKFKDIFDLKEFYTALREYLNDNDWKDIEDHDEHWESQYGEHVRQGGVKEMWIWWRLHKVPKNQSYITYYLDFDWHNLTSMLFSNISQNSSRAAFIILNTKKRKKNCTRRRTHFRIS